MTEPPMDPELAAVADLLDAQRPRPGRDLRRRIHGVLTLGIRQRALRRQAVLLVSGGLSLLTLAAVLALNAPS